MSFRKQFDADSERTPSFRPARKKPGSTPDLTTFNSPVTSPQTSNPSTPDIEIKTPSPRTSIESDDSEKINQEFEKVKAVLDYYREHLKKRLIFFAEALPRDTLNKYRNSRNEIDPTRIINAVNSGNYFPSQPILTAYVEKFNATNELETRLERGRDLQERIQNFRSGLKDNKIRTTLEAHQDTTGRTALKVLTGIAIVLSGFLLGLGLAIKSKFFSQRKSFEFWKSHGAVTTRRLEKRINEIEPVKIVSNGFKRC